MEGSELWTVYIRKAYVALVQGKHMTWMYTWTIALFLGSPPSLSLLKWYMENAFPCCNNEILGDEWSGTLAWSGIMRMGKHSYLSTVLCSCAPYIMELLKWGYTYHHPSLGTRPPGSETTTILVWEPSEGLVPRLPPSSNQQWISF